MAEGRIPCRCLLAEHWPDLHRSVSEYIALLPDEQRPQWKNHCTLCLGCYHRCPQQAIRFGKYTEKKGQYHRKDFLADP